MVENLVEKGAQLEAKDEVRIDMYKMWQILHSVATFDHNEIGLPCMLVYMQQYMVRKIS